MGITSATGLSAIGSCSGFPLIPEFMGRFTEADLRVVEILLHFLVSTATPMALLLLATPTPRAQ